MNFRPPAVFPLLSIVILVWSCGGPPTGGEEATTSVGVAPSSSHAPTDQREYATVKQIRNAVEATGYRCAYFQRNEPTSAIDWLEEGVCSEQVSFFILRDQSAVDAQIADLNRKVNDFLGRTSVQIRGSNWIVNCSDRVALCEGFESVLGGELIVSEP